MEGVKVVELGRVDRRPGRRRRPRRLGRRRRQDRAAGGRPGPHVPADARRRPAEQPGVRARQPRQAQHRARPHDGRRAGPSRSSCSTPPTCSSRTSAPPRWRRLGLDDETLLARNPRLVYGHITGYGREGPDADKAAFDIAAFWSRAGIAHLLTPPGGTLPFQRGGMGDHNTGSTFAGGICAALFSPRAHGRGPARVVVAVPPGRLHGRLRPQHRARLGPPPGDRHARDDGQPVGQQLRGRRRPALLDRRPRGRPPLAAARPHRRPPGVARRPALRHAARPGDATPPS